MKGGANPTEIQDIQKYFRAGHNAEAIAQAMNLSLACVTSFHPDSLARVKAAKKKAETKAQAAHKKKKDILAAARLEASEAE